MILEISSALWVLWLLYWLISARHRADGTGSAGVWREGAGSRLVHLSFMLAVAILLTRNDLPFGFLRLRVWPHALGLDLLGLPCSLPASASRYGHGKFWERIGRQELPPPTLRL